MEQRHCSQCGAVLNLTSKEASLGYGQVIKKCPYCGKVYYENRINEISVQGMKKTDKFIIRPKVFCASLGCILMGVAITAVLIFAIINDVSRIRIFALMGPLWIVAGIFQLFKESITYLKRLSNLKKERKESFKRLNDPIYRNLLFLALPPNATVKYEKNCNHNSNDISNIRTDIL